MATGSPAREEVEDAGRALLSLESSREPEDRSLKRLALKVAILVKEWTLSILRIFLSPVLLALTR